MNLRFGLAREIPEPVTTAWGARLIAPADLVPDRQDCQGDDADALMAWLNGGVLDSVLALLREQPLPNTNQVFPIYEDDHGAVVGSALRSFGYIYVAAWLHPEAS